MSKSLMRFKANVLGPNEEGFMKVEIKVIHQLGREDGLKYAKENNIEIPKVEDFKGLDVTDPYVITTKSKTKESAIKEVMEFIKDFTKTISKDLGQVTLIDMKTGKVSGSESNLE